MFQQKCFTPNAIRNMLNVELYRYIQYNAYIMDGDGGLYARFSSVQFNYSINYLNGNRLMRWQKCNNIHSITLNFLYLLHILCDCKALRTFR